MLGNANIGDGEEYSPLGPFPIMNLSPGHIVIEVKNGKSFQPTLILKIKLFVQCCSMI